MRMPASISSISFCLALSGTGSSSHSRLPTQARAGPVIGLGQRHLAFLARAQCRDDAPQGIDAIVEQFALAVFQVGADRLHGAAQQAAGGGVDRPHLEALRTARLDHQQAELLHVAFDDMGDAADVDRDGRRVCCDLVAALDQADAEWGLLAQAGAHHVDVAGLEDAQRQQATRKQHRVQREQWQLGRQRRQRGKRGEGNIVLHGRASAGPSRSATWPGGESRASGADAV